MNLKLNLKKLGYEPGVSAKSEAENHELLHLEIHRTFSNIFLRFGLP
jgi:hypothetical protein